MKVDGQTLRLVAHPLASLYPHEETSEALLNSLSRRMAQEGVQRDPIIVDGTSKVILDGMHRHAALKSLGVRFAACFELDYMNDGIAVFRWLRYLRHPQQSTLVRVRTGLQLSRELSANEATSLVEARDSPVALLCGGRGFVGGASRAKEDAWTIVREFDKIVTDCCEVMEIVEEGRAKRLEEAQDSALLLTPRLTKEDVVDAGFKGRLFPLKTTLHVLPIRVVGVNVPLSSLMDKSEAEAAMERITSSANLKVLNPPANYEGRLYKERLVILA